MSRAAEAERRRLTELVQYLNLEEMKRYCGRHRLALYIHVETGDAARPLARTSDRDRKDVVLRRILDFALEGRRTGPTVYRLEVVGAGPLPAPITARTRVRYGQYEKHNPAFVAKLVELTGGRYRNGMIARLTLRDFWTAGVAPTMKQLAAAWIEATEEHARKGPRPEGAYLADLARGHGREGWKELRVEKAREALRRLGALTG